MKIALICNHTLIPDWITNEGVVIDAGAHGGEFSRAIHDLSGARVYGFEANPDLFTMLSGSDRIEFIEAALAGKDGEVLFHKQEPERGSIVHSCDSQETVSVRSVTLEGFCAARGIKHINLLKLDIEGAELDVLETASDIFLKRIGQLTVEFHDFVDQSQLPRIRAIHNRLKSLGYYGVRLSVHTWGDCLYINSSHHPLSRKNRLELVIKGKYLPGLRRVVRKLFWNKSGHSVIL